MKSPILLLSVSALALAACTHYTEKEIVEQAPVATETVVERPVAKCTKGNRDRKTSCAKCTRETIIERTASPSSCTLASGTYSDGSILCQNGFRFRCEDGAWNNLNGTC
jgi:hypothetical protein